MIEPRIDTNLVRALIADQFPAWADLSISQVATSGWDNRMYHLGGHMSVRLPSAACYAAQVAKEQKWLPRLAPKLPLPISQPIAMGLPTDQYPFEWSVMRWLPGTPATDAKVKTRQAIAVPLADFLVALHQIPANGGPAPGAHNFHRGGDLRIYDQEVRHCLKQLGSSVDADRIMRLWTSACHSAWPKPPVWLHGDMASGNFLIDNNQLAAIIDFGCCAIGDPACDLTIAWTFFDETARAAFRDRINLDKATWTRARGWALWKALLQITQGVDSERATLASVLTDTRD